jgi:sialate O-acetylesterase
MHRNALFGVLCFALAPSLVHADVRMPALFSDHMVIQRDADAPVWGWAAPGEEVTVSASWGGESVTVEANADGRWSTILATPGAGGPHQITVQGDNFVPIRNVFTGEVWICSGQSNMEWRVNGSDNAAEEMKAANYPMIRHFDVRNVISTSPLDDCQGKWTSCSPASVGGYTAVGYYFGRKLHQDLGVPIGLIATNWGGTVAEAWTSEGALAANFPEFQPALDQVAQMRAGGGSDLSAVQLAWWKGLEEKQAGVSSDWMTASFDDTEWSSATVPGNWSDVGLGGYDGTAWYRRSAEIPASWVGKNLVLELGPADDMDRVWANGQLIGETKADGQHQTARRYVVPKDCVTGTSMQLTVCVIDTGGAGSLGAKPEDMKLSLAGRAEAASISISGEWRFQKGTSLKEVGNFPRQASFHANTPTALYNGMIAPLVPFAIRGAIWYQGESNRGRAPQYRELFPAMIADWREAWGQGDFPFGFVQIAPYGYGGDTGQAAGLREAQTMTLSSPNTGMAVTMDLGNPADIHPRNKQDVGDRLALWALAESYGVEDLVYSGPMYSTHEVEGETIHLSMNHVHGGLVAEGGPLSHFTMAGADKVFHPATAEIDGGTIVVRCAEVSEPVAVRYAWGAADEPNLKNAEGLPAPSFRTDDWPQN